MQVVEDRYYQEEGALVVGIPIKMCNTCGKKYISVEVHCKIDNILNAHKEGKLKPAKFIRVNEYEFPG